VKSARFDDPNLVSTAGLVPVMALAERAGLGALVDEHVSALTLAGARASAKVSAAVAGMVAGADSFEDLAVVRHGAMPARSSTSASSRPLLRATMFVSLGGYERSTTPVVPRHPYCGRIL